MKMGWYVGFCALVFLAPEWLPAQSVRALVNNGNSQYKEQKYADAEVSYRKALEKEQGLVPGHYNLGSALYKQEKVEEAIKEYENALLKADTKETRSEAYFNMGNALMKGQRYQDAVKSYIESLKLNPGDADAKYNLSYALEKLKQQQQQQQDKNDKNKDKQDQKDQQKQDQDKQNQDQQKQEQQQQQEKQQQNQEQKQQQGQEKRMAKADAERILDVLKNSEKDVQKKLRVRPAVRSRTEKDW